jgi:hypothetical protein
MRSTSVGARTTALLVCLAAIGCSAHVATLPGILGPEAYPPAMVLATGATGEDCGTSILFVRLRQASLGDAVARAIASVPEATLLTDVEVHATAFVTGVYNRGCVRVRGSAAKLVSSVVVPMPEGHHGHHDESR